MTKSAPSIDPAGLISCHDCDLLIAKADLPPGTKALCPRCGGTVRLSRPNSIERTLALALTSLLFYVPANIMPIMGMRVMGQMQNAAIHQGVRVLGENGQHGAALLVFISAMAAPLVKILLGLHVSLCLFARRCPDHLPACFRLYLHLDEWAMLEVYMLGILVAVVKLMGMATVLPGPGLYCFIALLLSTTTMTSMLDPDRFWEEMERLRTEKLP